MCAIAGMMLQRTADEGDVGSVRRMLDVVVHRGPDDVGLSRVEHGVLGAARLAIVATSDARQPFRTDGGAVHVVMNGEVYNYRALREQLVRAGHAFLGESEVEVLARLYETFGEGFVSLLEGQFAIALFDARRGELLLARDGLGICPLFWAMDSDGLYFCSEVKGLLATGRFGRVMSPTALVQMAYFGTVCAPHTAFHGIHQLPPGTLMVIGQSRKLRTERYWKLEFPAAGHHERLGTDVAIDKLRQLLRSAVDSRLQGEYPPACFLSGGVDSATIAALLSASRGHQVRAFCAGSEHSKINEGGQAQWTASRLGLNLDVVCIDESMIARDFPRLVWHGEVPLISTEATALMHLAGEARKVTKIVLTGEGADEAFGGYLAFRQARWLGGFTRNGLQGLRSVLRPLLHRHYGSDCLLPAEQRLDSVREVFGFHPAQAYEWEFYRAALSPLLAPSYRAMVDADDQWSGFEFDATAVRDCHWLNRSLSVAYQVMLPNYLLGAHGDRIFAAQSVEGRYPFLARDVVEFAAGLDPDLKLRGMREKFLLRRAAEQWLPPEVTSRPKARFVMPFGTPFLGKEGSRLYSYLLSPQALAEYGYFDPARVALLLEAATRPPRSGSKASRYLQRLAQGLGLNFVVSTQLWHHIFVVGDRSACGMGHHSNSDSLQQVAA